MKKDKLAFYIENDILNTLISKDRGSNLNIDTFDTGENHTILLKDDDVYVTGINNDGEFGSGDDDGGHADDANVRRQRAEDIRLREARRHRRGSQSSKIQLHRLGRLGQSQAVAAQQLGRSSSQTPIQPQNGSLEYY